MTAEVKPRPPKTSEMESFAKTVTLTIVVKLFIFDVCGFPSYASGVKTIFINSIDIGEYTDSMKSCFSEYLRQWGLFFLCNIFLKLRKLCKKCNVSMGPTTAINPFIPNAHFLYPLKTSEHRKVFWYFQRVEKGCNGNERVYIT